MDHAPSRNSKSATLSVDPLQVSVADMTSERVIVYNADRRILHWNLASQTTYGWAETEVIGRRLAEFVGEDGVDWSAVAAKSLWQGRARRKTAAGEFVELRLGVQVHRDQAGAILSIVESGRLAATPEATGEPCLQIDPQVYRELKGSETRYRNLINNVPLPLWQIDARMMTEAFEGLKASGVGDIIGHCNETPGCVELARESVLVTGVNDSAIRLLNASGKGELLGPVRYLFSASPETATRIIAARFNERCNYIEEMKLRAFDGRLLDVLLFVTFPQTPDNPDLALIMMVDVTAQRRAERQLRKVESDFAHAARVSALGELVTTIAHEVRQPLSVIVTDADTGTRWLDRDAPNIAKVKAIMARIMENSHRANQVISRIQDMTVKRDPVRQQVEVNAVVEEALAIVAAESQVQAIAVSSRLDDRLPIVLGDRIQLQQVVVNLLLNSIQAISVSAPEMREIFVETSIDGRGTMTLSVRDTGGGIPSEHLDRIFNGFFSTKTDSMGIGLAICRSIVDDHGGTISVANEVKGANFRVTLPISVPDETPKPNDPDTQAVDRHDQAV
jgi:signal transduction histidine kinase